MQPDPPFRTEYALPRIDLDDADNPADLSVSAHGEPHQIQPWGAVRVIGAAPRRCAAVTEIPFPGLGVPAREVDESDGQAAGDISELAAERQQREGRLLLRRRVRFRRERDRRYRSPIPRPTYNRVLTPTRGSNDLSAHGQ